MQVHAAAHNLIFTPRAGLRAQAAAHNLIFTPPPCRHTQLLLIYLFSSSYLHTTRTTPHLRHRHSSYSPGLASLSILRCHGNGRHTAAHTIHEQPGGRVVCRRDIPLPCPSGPVGSRGHHTSCEWHRGVGRLHPYLHPELSLRPAHEFANRGKLAAKTAKPR